MQTYQELFKLIGSDTQNSIAMTAWDQYGLQKVSGIL